MVKSKGTGHQQRALQILRLIELFYFFAVIVSKTKGRKERDEGEKVHSSHHISNVAILKMNWYENIVI